jgi:hypothetical protein
MVCIATTRDYDTLIDPVPPKMTAYPVTHPAAGQG